MTQVKRRVLGRGLSALLPGGPQPVPAAGGELEVVPPPAGPAYVDHILF